MSYFPGSLSALGLRLRVGLGPRPLILWQRGGASPGLATSAPLGVRGWASRGLSAWAELVAGKYLEQTCWDPKDGELCLARTKPEETLVEVRRDSDVQIDRRS